MRFRIGVFVIACIVFGLGAAAVAFSQEQGGRKIVGVGEVVQGDYVAAGETVEIAGTVQGDVYILGGQVLVNGVVEGDLLVLGGTVSIAGEVQQNIRAAGWQVVVSGKVGRNSTIGAMNVEITKRAQLQGSLVVGAANVVLNGPIENMVRIAGRNLTITSMLGGNVDAAVENIRLAPGATIAGDFTYWSNRDVSLGDSVHIQGTVTKKAQQGPGAYIERTTKPITQVLKPFFGIVSFVTSLVVGIVVVRVFSTFSRKTVLTLRTRKWRSLTSGITSLLLLPIVFGLLIITIVGIPLGFVLLLLSSVTLYVARIFVMLWIGMFLSEKLNKNISDTWAFTLGLLVYSALGLVPIVGWVISFLAVLLGLGAAVQTIKENYFAKNH